MTTTSLVPASARASRMADASPSVTKVKSSASRMDSGVEWVTTKNGGAAACAAPYPTSSFQPCGPSMMSKRRRPITTAPERSVECSRTCASTSSSLNAQRWSGSPPWPSPCSRSGSGPVTNPSSDIVMSAITFAMEVLRSSGQWERLPHRNKVIVPHPTGTVDAGMTRAMATPAVELRRWPGAESPNALRLRSPRSPGCSRLFRSSPPVRLPRPSARCEPGTLRHRPGAPRLRQCHATGDGHRLSVPAAEPGTLSCSTSSVLPSSCGATARWSCRRPWARRPART